MNDEVRNALEDAGRREVPEPRDDFATGLEQRLLTLAKNSPPDAPPQPARRPSVFGLAAGLVAVALALAVAVTILGNDDRSSVAFELSDSVNVVVVLADGTTLVDPDGLLLPDGAVVQVGVDGSARVGDIVLTSGDTATIVDRRLRVDRQPRSAVVSPNRPTTTPSHSTPTPATSKEPSENPPAPAPPASSATPTASPTRPTATPTAAPDTSPSSTPPSDVRYLRLTARVVGPSEVRVTWERIRGAHRYILIGTRSRDGPAATPRYPGSWIIGRFAKPPAEALTFTVRDAIVEVKVRVIALAADGSVLTRSRIVTLTFPR